MVMMMRQPTMVNGIDVIAQLQLKTLVLGGIQINSLGFLKGNSAIEDLTLTAMPVNVGTELGTMPSLRKLSLVDVPIADISPLLSLPKLREVSLLRVPARADVISALQRNGVKVTNN
jgi:Leucine-rich repeat (LRR) protein